MKFHSAKPEVVGTLDPDWDTVIPADFDSAYMFVMPNASGVPQLKEIMRLDFHEYAAVNGLSGGNVSPATWDTTRKLMPLMQSLLAVTDTDLRARRELDPAAATQHSLSIRSGLGTITSIHQNVLKIVSPQKKLKKSIVHIDGGLKKAHDANHELYTLTQGEGTLYWEGDFWAPRSLGAVLGSFALAPQVIGRPPAFISSDNEINHVPAATVHRAPKSSLDVSHPRRFIRDIATAIEA